MQIIYDVEQIISFLFNETILSLKCIAVLQNCKKKMYNVILQNLF